MEATKRPPPPPPPPPKMEGARNQGEQAGSGSPPAPPPPPPVAQGSSAAESRPAPPPPPPAQPPAAQAGSGALSPPLPHALPGVLPASPAAPAVPASPAVPAAQAAPPPPPQTLPPRTTAASEPTSEIVPVVAPAPGASKTSRIAEAGAENESATHATVNDHDHDSIRLAPALEDRLSGINNTAAGAPGGITRSGNSNVGSVAAEGAAAKAESPAQMTETVTVPPPVAGTHSGAFEAIASSRRESAREKVMRDPIVAIYEDEPAEINRLLNIQTSSTEQSSHAARQNQKAKASASYRSQQKVRKNVQSKLEDIGVAFKNIFETAGEKADDLTSKVKGGEGGELSRKLQGKEAEELGVLPDPVDTEKKVDLIGTEIDDVTAQIEAERLKGANVVDSPLNTPWLLMGAPVAPLGIMYTWTVMSFVLPPLYAVGVWVLFLLPWRVWLMLFFGAMVGVLASWGALRDSALRPVILQVDRAFLELQDKIHEQWKKHEDDIMRVVNEKFFRDVYPLLVKLDDLFKSKAGYSLLRAFVAKRKGLRHDELVAEVLPFEDRKDEEEYDEYENYFLVSIAFESLRDIWNPKFKSVWIDWVVDDMVVETLAPRDLELFPKGDKGIHYGTANMNPDDNTFRITQEVRMSYFPARELPNLQDNYNDTCITLRLMGRKVLPLYSSDGKTRFLKDDEARGDHAICIGHANISAKRLGCGMTRQRGKMIYSDARIPFFVEGFEDYHCAVAFVKTSVTVVHHSSYSYRERVSSLPSGDWSLRIHIFEMRALSAADDTGSSDPYVEVEAFKTTKTTNMFRQTLSCVVDEMLVFNQALTGPELEEAKAKLSVFDWNFMSSPQLIGQIFFDVSNIYRLPNQEIYRQWFAVYHPEKGSKAQGYLKLSVSVLSPGGSIPVLHAEYEDREEFSTAVLLKNQVVKAPTFAVKSFVVHVTVGWADMIARMANDFTSRDVVRGFLMVEITGFAQLISQTFIGAPRPIADELLGDACRVDVNRAIIVNEEFLLPLSVINGAITVDAVRIKLMHRTQSSVTENKLVGEVDLHMQELLEGRFEAVVRGNPDDGETPGDRIETVAMLEPRWYNFYGNQYGMLDTEAKQVAFRGRLLVGAAAKSGSVRKPFSRPCAPPTRPRTALYSFELQISRATELPLVGKLVGVQAKLGIYEFGHKFPRVPVRNKCCDWDENSLLRATFLQFPEDIDQVPDLFVTLLKRDDNGEPAGGSNSAGKEGGAASGASLRAGGGFGAGAGGGGIGLISESGGESGEGADGEWTVFAYLRIPVAHMILKQPEPKWMFMDFPGDSVGNEGSVPGSLLINAQMSRMDISIEEYVEYKRAQQEEVDATITGSTVGTAVAGSNPAVGDMAGTVGPQVQVGTANMPPPSAAAPPANGTGTSSSEKTQSAIVSAAVVAAGMAAGTEDAASTVATAGPTPGSTGLTLEDDADEAARLAAASKLAREMRLASIRQRIDAVERTGYFTPRLGVEKYYTLRALVLKGRDLPAADASGLSDPLFTISVGNRTVDWKIYCEQTKNPVWDAFIVVKNIMVREGQRFPNVNVMVKDYNEDLNFDYLGRAMINISDIEEDPVDFRTARWYPVFSASPEYQNGEILADFQLQAQLGLEEEEIQEQEPPQQEVAQSPNDRQAESGNLYQSLDTKLAARVGGECELPRRTNRYLRLSVLGVEDLRFLRPAAGKVHLEMTVTREEPMPQVTRSGNLLLDREFEANVSILDVVFLRVGMPEQGRRYAESLNVFCKGTFPYMKPGNDSHLIGTTSIDLAGYVPMLRRQEKTYKDLAMDKYGMDDPVPRYLVQKYHYFARISVEDIPHAVFSRELNFNARVDRNHGLEDEEDDIPEEDVDRLLNHFSRSASRISQLDTSAENEALNNASSGGKETNVMGTPPVVSGAAKKAPWLRVGYHEEILTEKQKKMIELSKKLAEMQKQMAIVMAQVRASLYNVNDAISSAMPDVALKLGLPESHEEPLLMAKKLEEEELAVSSESTALLRRERGFCPNDLEFDLPGSIFGELALTRGDTRSLGAITGDALRAKHVDVKDEVAEGVGERELIIQEKRLALLEGKRPVIGKAKLRMDLVNLDEDPEGGLKGVTDEKLRLEMARLSSFRSFGRALRPTEAVVRVYVLRALNLEQTHNVCNPYLVAKFFGGYPNKYSMKYSPVLNTDNPTFFTMFESRVMLPSAQIRLEVKDRVLPKTEISIQYPWFVRGPSGSKFGLAKSEVPLDAGYFGLGWSELIGDTEIDLDQRWYNPQWRNLKITPIEARSLWRAGNVNLKGKLELFIDMIAARDYDARPHSFLPFKLPAPEKKKFLMRVVIFKVMDAYLPYIRSDNPNYMSNLYVACKVGNESSGFRKTDLCRFVVDGKGQWNWRMSWWLELPDTELKPRLKVQVFDNTGFGLGSDDLCASGDVKLRTLFDELLQSNELTLKKRQWVILSHPSYPQIDTRVELAIEVLPESQVGLKKCGYGTDSWKLNQDEDYILPYPFRPVPFSLTNPAPFFNYQIMSLVNNLQWQLATYLLPFPFLPMILQLAWMTPWWWYGMGGVAGLIVFLRVFLLDMARYERMRAEEKKQAAEAEAQVGEVKITKDVDEQGS